MNSPTDIICARFNWCNDDSMLEKKDRKKVTRREGDFVFFQSRPESPQQLYNISTCHCCRTNLCWHKLCYDVNIVLLLLNSIFRRNIVHCLCGKSCHTELWFREITMFQNLNLTPCSLFTIVIIDCRTSVWSELRFVATVTTGGCVKFVPAV